MLARTTNGSAFNETNLGTTLSVSHRYRIDWTATNVVYYVDGVQVASHAIAISTSMRPVVSNLAGGPTLSLDWLRMSPYATSGTFVSHVLDAGATTWLNLVWLGNQPAGTTVSFETHTGNSANPNDGTWSAWASISATGAANSPSARYLQYRATLTSYAGTISPGVDQVTISYY